MTPEGRRVECPLESRPELVHVADALVFRSRTATRPAAKIKGLSGSRCDACRCPSRSSSSAVAPGLWCGSGRARPSWPGTGAGKSKIPPPPVCRAGRSSASARGGRAASRPPMSCAEERRHRRSTAPPDRRRRRQRPKGPQIRFPSIPLAPRFAEHPAEGSGAHRPEMSRLSRDRHRGGHETGSPRAAAARPSSAATARLGQIAVAEPPPRITSAARSSALRQPASPVLLAGQRPPPERALPHAPASSRSASLPSMGQRIRDHRRRVLPTRPRGRSPPALTSSSPASHVRSGLENRQVADPQDEVRRDRCGERLVAQGSAS